MFHFEKSILVAGLASLLPLSVSSQITTDGTTSTTVDRNGNNFSIGQGDRAGSNLFHSFRDFSVPNGGSAFFDNPTDIANIFSRVTGGNISNIDGLIRANDANLFLINPAGVIFGAGARLDLGGGSFYGSSADSILFEDGEFSATDLENPPLLTINAPIGLSFRDNPGAIINDGANLAVNQNETISLIGGDIEIKNNGNIFTPEGRIELASVSGGQIRLTPLDEVWQGSYEDIRFGDIKLSQSATVNASGVVNGDIQIQSRNLTLNEGSRIITNTNGNAVNSTTPGAIAINVADTINLDNSSRIASNINPEAVGDAGGININTKDLNIFNGSRITTTIFGRGDAGSIVVNATDKITLAGEDASLASTIASDVNAGAIGNSGNVSITANSLTATNGGTISATTRGRGNAGSVVVNVADTITLDGEDSRSFPSVIVSSVNQGSEGNAGDVTINTSSFRATNGARVAASTVEPGNSGSITLNASDSIELSGRSPTENFPSGIFSGTAEFDGNGGEIDIFTDRLTISDTAAITAGNFPPDARFQPGTGQPGNINIEANSISLINGSIDIATQSPISNGANITLKNESIPVSEFY
jgi:filamentous hemagglutinin family protein